MLGHAPIRTIPFQYLRARHFLFEKTFLNGEIPAMVLLKVVSCWNPFVHR